MLWLALLAGTLSTACNPENHHEASHDNSFSVCPTLKLDTTLQKEYVCQIQSVRHIELRALERGYLEHIFIDEGQMVHKGQLLFKLMPNFFKAELEKAQAEAKIREIEYQNTKSLAERNVVSAAELAMAKAGYDRAKAEVSLAEAHYSFTEIKAPFDGIIDRFHVREGSLVDEGDLLSTLSDNHEVWVYFNVPEAEYLEFQGEIKPGETTKLELRMANNQIFAHSGILNTIEAEFDNETGNIPFRATFPNPEGLLRHGETGNIIMKQKLRDALIIPQKASFEILDKKFVFVVNQEGLVSQKEIQIAHELEDLYVVSAGLAEGEWVLLEGLRKVRDGKSIDPKVENPRSVIEELKLYAE